MSSIKWHTKDSMLIPERATKNSVGYDFISPDDYEIKPGVSVIIDSEVACDFSNDLWLGIYGRSSFIKKGLTNPLGVGVIDSDYYATGNTIKIVIYNNSDEVVEIKKGDAIAQGIFHKVITAGDEVITERVGGFGSTDVNDEYQLTVKIYGKLYKAKYVKDTYHNYYGILVYCDVDTIIFICKDEKEILLSGSAFFKQGTDELLNNRCWYFEDSLFMLKDATKEEATSAFIKSLLV